MDKVTDYNDGTAQVKLIDTHDPYVQLNLGSVWPILDENGVKRYWEVVGVSYDGCHRMVTFGNPTF